jgi:hypothetical protein
MRMQYYWLASYGGDSLGERSRDAIVQTMAERREGDALQGCHRTISPSKRGAGLLAGEIENDAARNAGNASFQWRELHKLGDTVDFIAGLLKF